MRISDWSSTCALPILGFLPRRHAAMPDRQPAAQLVDLANSFQRGSSYIVENAVFAVEKGFVVEHRIDRVVEQLPAVRRDERGDERVDRKSTRLNSSH